MSPQKIAEILYHDDEFFVRQNRQEMQLFFLMNPLDIRLIIRVLLEAKDEPGNTCWLRTCAIYCGEGCWRPQQVQKFSEFSSLGLQDVQLWTSRF